MVYICIGMYSKFNKIFSIIRFHHTIKHDINHKYLFHFWTLCKTSTAELTLKHMVMKLCKFHLKMHQFQTHTHSHYRNTCVNLSLKDKTLSKMITYYKALKKYGFHIYIYSLQYMIQCFKIYKRWAK